MSEREKIGTLAKLRQGATAAILIPAAALFPVENAGSQATNNTENSKPQIETLTDSFFEQVDKFAETEKGKALTAAFLAFTAAAGISAVQQSLERDKKRKVAESLAASACLFSLSATLFAQSYTDTDPKLPASLLAAYSLIQGIYNLESSFERDRSLAKRASVATATAGLLTASSIIFIDSLK